MRILVTGGTGLVGRRLVARLAERGDEVLVLSRQERPELPRGGTALHGDPSVTGPWLDSVARCDAVVHLAGANVFARRWRKRFKREIYDSRVVSTGLIARALADRPLRADGTPKAFACASAVGFYGPRGRDEVDEEGAPGTDFLARVCVDWEKATAPARDAGARVSHLRIGMVLDSEGGALPRLVRPFRWFVGGPIAGGKQWISWIHVADVVGLFMLAIDNPEAAGPINATAPEPVTNWGFCKILGKVLNRPSWLPVPGFALRILLGQVSVVATTGQRVIPRRAEQLGYSFQFAELEKALRDLLGRPAPPLPAEVVEN